MNRHDIWQRIELLLEKTEKSDLVRIDRADFEKALQDASDYAYIEIENAPLPDLLEKLRAELATLPMKSVQGAVVRIGVSPGEEATCDLIRTLLETIHKGTSGATLVWGYDEDPAIHAGRYSIAVVCAGSAQHAPVSD